MTQTDVTILAIESSCDETSVAVVKNGNAVLWNVVASQIKSHMRFGGVVPEVASRHHVEQITQIVEAALNEAQVTFDAIDAVAVTHGPGLVCSLFRSVSVRRKLLLLPIRNRSFRSNHMAGHIYANQLVTPMRYPLLSLVVSGGHSELVYMEKDRLFRYHRRNAG